MQSKLITVTEAEAGQRIDNFFFKRFKNIPKSRIYRGFRQGEVRVNKKRIKPDYKLKLKDQIRIPPWQIPVSEKVSKPGSIQLSKIENNIIYEDDGFIIVNKPAGIAVHGGSGVAFGVIEILRFLRPKLKTLELVHRIDRDTSGCLIIAKKRAVLVELHKLFREHQIEKVYLTLVKGVWQGPQKKVKLALLKNQLASGERIVKVNEEGKSAESIFIPIKKFKNATLMKVILKTGRTHQIRVHAAEIGYPIAGDEKYGDKTFNRNLRNMGLKRLFLHAAALSFVLQKQNIALCACMDEDLLGILEQLLSE